MKYLLLALLLVGWSDFSQASGWQVASNTLLIADWAQTLNIASRPDVSESNQILGAYPSRGAVNLYFISALIANNLLGDIYGDDWYILVSINQAAYVGTNAKVGIKFSF